jgi:putative spermidine/putrescine transport system permease protein
LERERSAGFYVLATFFVLRDLPLRSAYDDRLLSFQGPTASSPPMNSASLHWFANLFEKQAVGDFGGSFSRSLRLGLLVMIATADIASRRPCLPPPFVGATPLFYLTVSSLVVPRS